MTEASLAVFVFVSFLLPIPILAWLDRSKSKTDSDRQMYAGHFAAALALKAQVPRAPTWGLLVGVGVLGILFGPFVLAGIERVSLTTGISPGFSLDHIDWSHSLVMSVVWSILFGAAFLHRGRRVAAVMAVAVSRISYSIS